MDLKLIWNDELKLNRDELAAQLKIFGDLLSDPLSIRLDVMAYAEKLLSRAEIGFAIDAGCIVGIVALYANDMTTRVAHIPFLAVVPQMWRKGVGSALVSRTLARARARGMESISLEVHSKNIPAIALYRSNRFHIKACAEFRLVMQAELSSISDPTTILPTPLETRRDLAAAFDLDIDLKVKRDDLFPLSGGGTKARRIQFILNEAITAEHDVVITNGQMQSNHVRATALEAARLGIRCHVVLVTDPEEHYRDVGNILLTRLSGASLEHCSKSRLADAMDRAVARYASKGFNPMYIRGGGSCPAGTMALVSAAIETRRQASNWRPDFLVLASATGSTQAGLALGYGDLETRVVGISVARDRSRGMRAVQEHIDQINGNNAPKIEFLDDWFDGGYGKCGEDLLALIRKAAHHGFLLDSTYSGKGWRGLVELVRRRDIPPKSKVLFWHTGGLMNIQAGLSTHESNGIDSHL
jgi:1-aminocyclopropane-1-carboxylate deaminase/D-cysteine desulfhydrase-like pyridoxal-dependent ACC family enzyme/GNAT superfamily N-acetyltransferase